jgi:hypothetical protein
VKQTVCGRSRDAPAIVLWSDHTRLFHRQFVEWLPSNADLLAKRFAPVTVLTINVCRLSGQWSDRRLFFQRGRTGPVRELQWQSGPLLARSCGDAVVHIYDTATSHSERYRHAFRNAVFSQYKRRRRHVTPQTGQRANSVSHSIQPYASPLRCDRDLLATRSIFAIQGVLKSSV